MIPKMQLVIAGVLVLINLHSLILFYVDKQRAIKKQYRLSEKRLLLSAIVFGGVGAWIGMNVFRHKTRRTIFRVTVPFSALLTIGATIFILLF
ncbi:DUF1294 domain-containing protein [Alkalibacterium olivapovliticus]|uniref:Uncharacterized membrane protein YsdA (DUF1294 family) n=1 Tax=Alkalibacterium olivapovliticus TaxID=99907 RepID=A0A2T0W821_9LACT|nr:DUF1294 domain-containing protein [Alkalibacterium olivapovliticus]PRY82832.1 uncharacterized membrane protein YsdA (DUF1294 family) [Alkalibacterium olivapovliticus]